MPATAVRAAWVLPIASPPLADGGVLVAGGCVLDVGPWAAVAARIGHMRASGEPVDEIARPSSVVLPSLVNAHVHLELSWMHRRVPPSHSMPDWVARLITLRRTHGDDPSAIDAAVARMRTAGVGAVGDIGNSVASWASLERHGMAGVLFHEVLGFRPTDAARIVHGAAAVLPPSSADGRLRATLAPHAPYSVSPELVAAVRAWADANARGATSMHLGESPDEMRFLADGRGEWRLLLEAVGAWWPGWEAPACGPVEYVDRIAPLAPGFVAVHGVQLDRRELDVLASRGAALVTCPRSNRHVGVGSPPVAAFVASGVTLAVGTDSLASNEDLNPFAELAELRRLAPGVPARSLLKAATQGGARALGLEDRLGTIERGREASLIAVSLPARIDDVEEYLVSGITESQVSWVRAV